MTPHYNDHEIDNLWTVACLKFRKLVTVSTSSSRKHFLGVTLDCVIRKAKSHEISLLRVRGIWSYRLVWDRSDQFAWYFKKVMTIMLWWWRKYVIIFSSILHNIFTSCIFLRFLGKADISYMKITSNLEFCNRNTSFLTFWC